VTDNTDDFLARLRRDDAARPRPPFAHASEDDDERARLLRRSIEVLARANTARAEGRHAYADELIAESDRLADLAGC
jgi:hypothetical protein